MHLQKLEGSHPQPVKKILLDFGAVVSSAPAAWLFKWYFLCFWSLSKYKSRYIYLSFLKPWGFKFEFKYFWHNCVDAEGWAELPSSFFLPALTNGFLFEKELKATPMKNAKPWFKDVLALVYYVDFQYISKFTRIALYSGLHGRFMAV